MVLSPISDTVALAAFMCVRTSSLLVSTLISISIIVTWLIRQRVKSVKQETAAY
jgi:hypothetical protein